VSEQIENDQSLRASIVGSFVSLLNNKIQLFYFSAMKKIDVVGFLNVISPPFRITIFW
jgi:hypothetical protein